MKIMTYDAISSVNYARKWANKRNPTYYNFDLLGGDCTNFVSQCVYSGARVMNYTPIFGWFYKSLNDRSPAWSGVNQLYKFLTTNISYGPFGKAVNLKQTKIGDVLQFGSGTNFYHTVIVSKIYGDEFFVCSHTNDALDRPLSSYFFDQIRCIHIEGVRK